jgi:hypothetical protein
MLFGYYIFIEQREIGYNVKKIISKIISKIGFFKKNKKIKLSKEN